MHFTTRAHLAAQQCMQLASTQIFKPPLRSRVAWIHWLFVHYFRISAGQYGGVRSKKLLKKYVKRQINSFSSECTVNAGELGPLGKLGPDNTWLNKIGFFLLLQYSLPKWIWVSCFMFVLPYMRENSAPRGKLGPDNNWLNKIGFFLLLQ